MRTSSTAGARSLLATALVTFTSPRTPFFLERLSDSACCIRVSEELISIHSNSSFSCEIQSGAVRNRTVVAIADTTMGKEETGRSDKYLGSSQERILVP